jgi:hypothetical protein
MQITRRRLFASAAPAALLAGCGITINPATGVISLPPSVIDFITKAVSVAAKYIPVVESIAAVAASLFGPGFASIVTIGSQAINSVIAYLTNLVAPPASARRLGVGPSGSVLVGYTSNGVPVYGYR